MVNPFSLMLAMVFSAPMMLGQRGPRWYWGGRAAMAFTGALASIVWLGTPFAIWKAFGMWWMMAWLIPTTLVLTAAYVAPMGGGG